MLADQILEMIEAVDPLDFKALEEIDKAFTKLIGVYPKPLTKYSQSRDALKYKRPEGWCIHIRVRGKGLTSATINKGYTTFHSPLLNCECLAELYVIVYAIKFESEK